MRTHILTLLISFLFVTSACEQKEVSSENLTENQEHQSTEFQIYTEEQKAIIDEHLKNDAWRHDLYSREYQEAINRGLEKDSTISYLWQQKAMPLFKQGKYEVGMEFIDQAVKYDPRRYQDYRAFIKCVFAKTYKAAIIDFEDCKKKYGNSFVMDHTYDFYIALSYLQLNEFEKAEQIFEKDHAWQLIEKGEDWLHHLDLFYYGISRYEQRNYTGAIEMFDQALAFYPDFSDVQVYKAKCLSKLGKTEEAEKLYKIAEINGRKGFTINEDNAIYERYPYQMRWH
ncbi:tetratricopeptide repeat protein [Marivirga sp. S37H4]|uniref:Tetratricopeptide repeat protein n=1 Tax=Marivirga aurantiaca TaxID=2802615 RepID=A0A935CAD7_9BACT|nr:tetratricopeptide repeat protein [Marivirga aurantiaca]MBK6264748.1 tetratricopeptide repeat protein [Marivirga aurantiaca]